MKYINIVNYMTGDSIKEQVESLIERGEIDENTRLFFNKNNCLTTEKIYGLMRMGFKCYADWESIENIVFAPEKHLLSRIGKEA